MTTTKTTEAAADAPRAKRPIKPNYAGQPEGRSAIEGYACPACKAAKGTRCTNGAGAPTAYVHPARFARWVKAGSKVTPTKAAARKAAAKPADEVGAKRAAKKAPAKKAAAAKAPRDWDSKGRGVSKAAK